MQRSPAPREVDTRSYDVVGDRATHSLAHSRDGTTTSDDVPRAVTCPPSCMYVYAPRQYERKIDLESSVRLGIAAAFDSAILSGLQQRGIDSPLPVISGNTRI